MICIAVSHISKKQEKISVYNSVGDQGFIYLFKAFEEKPPRSDGEIQLAFYIVFMSKEVVGFNQ